MKKIFFIYFLLSNIIFAQSLDDLLDKYEDVSNKSLQTVDEKLGHVFIYSQKDIRLMQYKKLGDILKELPIMNYNQNRFGYSSLSLAGSKTTVSGFFRFFINDHEISSPYNQSPFLGWGDIPLDFVDHIEVYYGDSSLALGNDTGIYFIRIYTKKAYNENGNELNLEFEKAGTKAQSFMHSQILENGWSYLAYFKNYDKNETQNYKKQDLKNNENRKYAYFQLNKNKTNIDIGYVKGQKDNFMGLSSDVVPDSGKLKTEDFYINLTRKFLYDNSVKAKFAYSINYRDTKEKNKAMSPMVGLSLLPVLEFGPTLPFSVPQKLDEKLKFTKIDVSLTKDFKYKNNDFIAGISFSKKNYDIKHRKTVNFFNQVKEYDDAYNGFNEEKTYSLFLENEYKLFDDLTFILNGKINKYERDTLIKDSTDKVYRVGFIYTPFENLGFKTFYTKTILPPTFYSVDFADKTTKTDLNSQKYNIYTAEGVFTTENSKFRVIFNDVRITDFLYFTPVGFRNIEDEVHSKGLTFIYDYQFDENNKIVLNYYTTRLNQKLNNSSKGGYIKFFGEYGKISYFSSIIYRNSYRYLDTYVPSAYDLNMGITYNYTDDFSISLQGSNILDKSTQSLYKDGLINGSNFSYEDRQKNFMLSMKWVF
ncbi:TonB-dependent receptor [Malaciobacter molluscorum]|uniref:TonB-dependent receptor plug domain-containing protein n=1 Tax=Malaciobacter molluscorum TaxID=1032072 RepID=UPI00100B0D8F|nr:TonB-dependent receptor plug domain-containing protein [Malaciobacter molluscorum]RXJ97491.1 TonB-dependent receptor [Malaciobacter molluscorum]